MSRNRQLNGCDYLMLGFDRELRRRGYAGNSCQVILELDAPIDPALLRQRLVELVTQYPLLASRPAGLMWPTLKPRSFIPAVRRLNSEPDVHERLFNEALNIHRGELIRFDLIDRPGQGMDVVFTWAHALMDARAAEYFLGCLGHGELPPPAVQEKAAAPQRPLSERGKMAWQATCHIEQLAKQAPRALRVPDQSVPSQLKYRIERFSVAETIRIRDNATKLGGLFGQAQFDAAASVLELHRLHQRLGSGSPSYCLPLPVSLRPKGSIEPLFSNQLAMLMLQFLPEQLENLADTVATLKLQTEQAIRTGLLDNGLMLSELSRCVPLPLYMAIVKYSMGGEIASVFYGDAGIANPLLNSFLGARIKDLFHVAAVTESPGIGVIFGRFQNQLRLGIIHAAPMLHESEAAEFTAALRNRLLNP